jgi:hypothetical protein
VTVIVVFDAEAEAAKATDCCWFGVSVNVEGVAVSFAPSPVIETETDESKPLVGATETSTF